MSGVLYLAATPIGNLEDLTLRAQTILQKVDAVACEDTRVTRRLLDAYGIDKPLFALHQHNERGAAEALLARAAAGANIVLVSDAGTPAISDPGAVIVRLAHERGITVTPLPGPNAAVTALCASGLAGDGFTFAGFIPSKVGERERFLQEFSASPRTVIFYESPHRIAGCLQAMACVYAARRRLCIARELTKTFEQIALLDVGSAPAWLAADANRSRGEFVLLLEGQAAAASDSEWQAMADDFAAAGLSSKDAAALAAKYTGAAKKTIYNYLISQKNTS